MKNRLLGLSLLIFSNAAWAWPNQSIAPQCTPSQNRVCEAAELHCGKTAKEENACDGYGTLECWKRYHCIFEP